MAAYYNEFDPFAAAWLRELIKAGLIADGEVDERSIKDVTGADTRGFTQVHFFAGIGGWSYALRLAGWPDDRPVWTGSCPCQPFSLAGAQKGFDDARHLWPEFKRLIGECHPATVFGEQVASASKWLGLVRSDLETMGYAVGAIPVQAASAGADHLRDRYWFVGLADANDAGSQGRSLLSECVSERIAWQSGMADSSSGRCPGAVPGQVEQSRRAEIERASDTAWVIGADGKARRVKPGVRLLAHGFPARVGLLRGFGNAIDPRPAKAFIQAAMT